jgi:hypothetical protein
MNFLRVTQPVPCADAGANLPAIKYTRHIQRAKLSKYERVGPSMVRMVISSGDTHFKRSPRFPELPQAPFPMDNAVNAKS